MEVNVQGQETSSFTEQDKQILDGQEPQQETQQEELIGGKFKSADDLLSAYQELEKKLSQSNSGYETVEQPSTEEEAAAPEAVNNNEEGSGLQPDQEASIMESVGGQEDFAAVTEWAKSSLDPTEIENYNKEVNSGDYVRARNALQSLKFAYQNAEGIEPSLIGGRISNNSTDVFRSTSEVETAMNDPRYLVDSAYTKDVEEKMSRSDILSPQF
tara:strand:- start:147 stop:788 length:642 start_codon:yes stop_codon:yes gene_type:complete